MTSGHEITSGLSGLSNFSREAETESGEYNELSMSVLSRIS